MEKGGASIESLRTTGLGLGVDRDNGHYIIIQSCPFCQLTCSLKFLLENMYGNNIIPHKNYPDHDLTETGSRTREALDPGLVSQCLKKSRTATAENPSCRG
ncbi:hypothetical protein TNCV_1189431 [Trichonephila clavipes]|nr:hypothetical protein TNCV_1189431 [Trichonephila clavipes]